MMEPSRTSPGEAGNLGPWPLGPLGLPRRANPAGPNARPRIAVLGLARSGLAAAELLLARDCDVYLWGLERPRQENLRTRLDGCVTAGAKLRLGPHESSWLEEIDALVKSPGVDPRIPFIREAKSQGVPILAELELASLAAEGPIVALTGTNGKSTTTAWVGHMLETGGEQTQVVGNIGRAFSEGVLESPGSTFVTEVSSFQLEDIHTFRPRVATWLNFSPDHLDRYDSLSDYRAAKERLFDNQRREDVAVLGEDKIFDDLAVAARRLRVLPEDRGVDGAFVRQQRIVLRSEGEELDLESIDRVALPGPHNLANAMAAATTAFAAGAPPEAISSSLASFPGLAHRLERVASPAGILCINDSKATNIDSLAVALESFDVPIHLIAGGVGKGQDFARLAGQVARRTSGVYLIGEDAPTIANDWSAARPKVLGSLEEALDAALAAATQMAHTKGVFGVILLSPGCASFDMFQDYEARGDCFRDLVLARTRTEGV